MGDPLLDSGDLATYLNDPSIDTDRAEYLIARAQMLCESVLSPLPTEAAVVVERVAGRAYTSTMGGRGKQIAAAGSPFGGPTGVYLNADDEADLRRLSGGGGAYSIDLLPADYVAPCGTGYFDDWDAIS